MELSHSLPSLSEPLSLASVLMRFRANGSNCIVKCNGWNYENAPQPGTVLTIKHSGVFHSSNKYKFPFLLRVRPDLFWEEVKETVQTEFNSTLM
jgi:hypothetical protein